MPIEIRELTIKVSVNPTGDGPASGTVASPGQGDPGTNDKEEIIAECVEQVMERIKDKTER